MLKKPAAPERPLTICFGIELSDGRFKTELHVPFPIPEDQQKKVMEQWFDMIQTGFRIGATSMDATFAKPETLGKNEAQPQ